MIQTILVFSAFFSTALSGGSAIAQNCTPVQEMIFELKAPLMGAYNLWDLVYGEKEYHENINSGFSLNEDTTYIAGLRRINKYQDQDIFIAKLDRRGREIWAKHYAVEGLQEIRKIMPFNDGILVAATVRPGDKGSQAWLGFFAKDGVLMAEQNIVEPKGNLQLEDIIVSHDKSFLIMSSNVEISPGRHSGAFYKLDENGKVVLRRFYNPGTDSKVFRITRTENNHYLLGGYARSDDRRREGWILILDEDGAVSWQRRFARGRSATIQKAEMLTENFIAMTGTTFPFNDEKRAAWVMVIDRFTGKIMWQRYFTGEFHYDGVDLLVNKDNLISVAMNAGRLSPLLLNPEQALTEEEQEKADFVRLLTLSPRGVVFASEEFFNGEGAHIYQMIEGSREERLMFGYTNSVYEIEPTQPEGRTLYDRGIDGLVIAASAIDPYQDPCDTSGYDFP